MRKSIAAVFVSILMCSTMCLADSPRVWVQPFTEANDRQSPDWITKTLRQSLVDELATTQSVQLVSATTRPADAQFIVAGQIQRIDGELRVTGQVTDAAGKTAGGFKATGSDRELFGIEDSIASQVMAIIAPAPKTAVAAATPSTQPTRIEMPFAPNRFGPFEGSDLQQSLRGRAPTQRTYTTPVYSEPVYPSYPTYPVTYGINGYNNYNNPYGYGYGYGYNNWGYNYPGVIIIGRGGHRGHDGGGGGGGGIVCPPGSNSNGQAIRAASGFGGRTPPPGVVNTVTPGAPGTINTIGR